MAEAPEYELVVTQHFGAHLIGEVISDAEDMAAAPRHCVVRRLKVTLPENAAE